MEDEARDLNSLLSYLPTKDTNEQIPFHERPTGLDGSSAAHWDGDKAHNLFPIAFYQRQDKKQKAKPWRQLCKFYALHAYHGVQCRPPSWLSLCSYRSFTAMPIP